MQTFQVWKMGLIFLLTILVAICLSPNPVGYRENSTKTQEVELGRNTRRVFETHRVWAKKKFFVYKLSPHRQGCR